MKIEAEAIGILRQCKSDTYQECLKVLDEIEEENVKTCIHLAKAWCKIMDLKIKNELELDGE